MIDDSKSRQTFYLKSLKATLLPTETPAAQNVILIHKVSGLKNNNFFFAVIIYCVFLAAQEEAMEPFLQKCMLDQSLPIAQRWRALFSLRNLKGDEARQALIYGAF